jgi:two-component system sensor histidine kinase and response regulator WspE
MLELFRTEAQNYVAILNDGLIALEKGPDAIDALDPLMRAAHSIKGAARIVGFDVAAKVSHAMEDCFAAARKGEAALGPDRIRILLRGVDILNQITEAADATGSESVDRPQDDSEGVITAIRGILSAETAATPEVTPDAHSADAAAPERDTTTGEGQIEMVDPTMLDLFGPK